MPESAFAHIDDCLNSADLEAVSTWLDGLDEASLPAARRWWRKSGRSRARRLEDAEIGAVVPLRRTIQVLLAVAVAETPDEAVKACRWRLTYLSVPADALPVARALVGRGREFATEFIDLAFAVDLGRDGQRSAQEIAQIVSGAVEWFGLPLPQDRRYVDGWATALASAWWRSENRGPQPQLGLLRVVDGALVATTLTPDTRLVDLLRATPRLPEMLVVAARYPGVFSTLTSSDRRDGWHLDAAIAEVSADPGVDRSAVIAAAIESMGQPQNASSYRASVAILTGCAFGPADAATHEAEILGLLPTVHGWAAPILVDALLAADPGEGSLFDLGSVVLTRKEKGPKKRLVDHLLAHPAHPDAADLLAMAVDHVDGPLREKVVAATDAPSESAARTVGWQPEPTRPRGGPLVPVDADLTGIGELWSVSSQYEDLTFASLWIDVALRLLNRGRDIAEAAFATLPPADPYADFAVWFIRRWLAAEPSDKQWTWRHPTFRFHAAHLEEALDRGTPLLSTPTDIDGTLSGDDLRSRLGRVRPVTCGLLDFVQTLLRLRPDSRTPARRKLLVETAHGTVDGIALLAGWVDGGGFAGWRRSGRALHEYLGLPDDLPQRPLLDGLSSPKNDVAYYEIVTYLSVLPLDADRLAGLLSQPDSAYVSRQLPTLVFAAGEVGDGVVDLVAAHLDHGRADVRATAAASLVNLARLGRTDPQRIREVMSARFESGGLSLTRLAHVVAEVADADALGVIWPAWFRIVESACGMSRKPTGLAAALTAGAEYAASAAAHVSDPVPPAARALAATTGKSAAVAAARSLVAAVSAPPTSAEANDNQFL